jgi:Methyltransferase domain
MIEEIVRKIELIREPLPGWCGAEKARVLAELIVERRPKLVAESGIFGGRSLCAMAIALKELKCGIAYGVDPWALEDALEGEREQANIAWWSNNVKLEEIYRTFVQAVLANGLTNECRWIRSSGHRAAQFFENGSIDVFHLDSNHSEVVSCREVVDWAPKMAARSIWVMDDTDWPSQAKAIEGIMACGYHIKDNRGSYIIFER